MIVLILIALVFIYLAGNVIRQLVRNVRIRRAFARESIGLTILPNPSIFTGNLFETTWSPSNYKNIDTLHGRYGQSFVYFMCEQPWMSTIDLDLIKLVFEKNNDRAIIGSPYKALNESIFQVNGDKWRRIRRAVSPTMTNLKVRGEAVVSDIDDIINQLQQSFRNKLAKRNDSSFEIDTMNTAKRFSLAVILLVTYKKNHVIDFESERDLFVDDISEGFKNIINDLALLSVMFPFIQPLMSSLVRFHKYGKNLKTIVEFTQESAEMKKAAEKRKLMDKSSQFIDKEATRQLRTRLSDEITETYLAGKLSYEELQGTLLLFIIAGYETVATTVSNLIWQLAQHPDIQEKLRTSINESGLDSEYLTWCILESIRWFTPVPLGIGRLIDRDIYHKGSKIPKGTFVMPSMYSVHHNAQIWQEPWEYKPERWANQSDFHPAAFLGFGLGPRNCVGSKLAMQELRMVFQMLLTNYQIEKCAATPDRYDFTSPFMFITELDETVLVRLVPRKV